MKYNKIITKKLFLYILFFVSFLPNISKSDIYIDFFDEGKVSYKTSSSKKALTQTIDDEGFDLKIGKEESYFKVSFFEDENYYQIDLSKSVPKAEDIYFGIPKNLSIKFEGNMACHSLTLQKSRSKDNGTFVNNGTIKFIDTNKLKTKCCGLHIKDNITLENNEKLIFKKSNILSLKNGFLINNKNITFQQEARIVGVENLKELGEQPLVFSEEQKPPLINNGFIKGEKKLALFTKCFISENGRINSSEQIIIDWNQNYKTPAFLRDINKKINIKQPDIEFPILDITRLQDSLRQQRKKPAELGELSAPDFYKDCFRKKCFAYRANAQDNGIDLVVYSKKNPTHLTVHESKNYKDNEFGLQDNQMTETWVYYYLFRMYQGFLKENMLRLQAPEHQDMDDELYDHLKNVFVNILYKDYLDDLKLLFKLSDGKLNK